MNTASASSPPKSIAGSTPSIQRSTFDDWVAAAEEDDEFYYQDRPRAPRGGKNRKKKNKGQEVRTWDWDDIYDPSRPNVYADYKGSEEQHREVKDWKARLYHRQLKEARKLNQGRSDEESDGTRPMNGMSFSSSRLWSTDSAAGMFAPPSQQISFAPPTFDDRSPPPPMDEDDGDDYSPPANGRQHSIPSETAPASVPNDATGDDAYLRRMRLSEVVPSRSPPAPSPPTVPAASMPAPVTSTTVTSPPSAAQKSQEALKAEALAKIAAFKAKYIKPMPKPDTDLVSTASVTMTKESPAAPSDSIRAESPPPPPPPLPKEPGVVISREPVRYNVSKSDPNDGDVTMDSGNGDDANPQSNTSQQQSNRPKKKGFGERLLKKYGWEKGQGLGAQGEGITTALVGKVDKRKKRSDAEGGGWTAPANTGKIVGGKRRKIEDDSNNSSDMHNLSSVIKLQGMLTGLDVQKEIEDNNLLQEIGDEMGNNYGNVERVFIWREAQGGGNEVFVKFTSQLSAMRAKDAMDGTTFADNEVQAAFWDEEKFERGEYGT